jgi:hypothetical protein
MSYRLFHIDDCMYVAAGNAEAAQAHVKKECGDGCGDSATEVSLDMPVTMANVDDGEEVTPDTMTTARALLEDHLKHGGEIPYTLCFDSGM